MEGHDGRVLIVDDEEGIRDILSRLVAKEGYQPVLAEDGEQALELVRRDAPDALLVDIKMPGVDGMEVLRQAKQFDRDLPVVVITSCDLVKDAVAALHAGAHDYIVKPFDHADVVRSVHSAITDRRIRRTIARLSEGGSRLPELMGPSVAIERISNYVRRVACSDFTVLILGETGTGKELIARAIHEQSARTAGPFIPVDCGAIPDTLFESELFGHEKGAFTGAERSKPGRFELAMGGTLFLDEIHNMPPSSQAKLLRALQERTVTRVGGSKPVKVDVRLLAAANEDLETAVAKGAFRQDLFFRLNEFVIGIPPLRERKEDIPFLVHRFLNLTNRELHKNVSGLTESAMQRMNTYEWPGNVRQLRSVVRRAVLLADSVVSDEHLALPRVRASESAVTPAETVLEDDLSLKERVRRATADVEREALATALRKTGGNKAKAARLLNIDYKTILNKLKEYGISTGGDADEE
jgi:DNA-binding NtrC family response regulator